MKYASATDTDQMGFVTKENDLNNQDRSSHFPKYLQIESVALCNARCIMCPVKEVKRKKKLLDDELFHKIVMEIREYSDWIEKVTIQLDGEPLIDKKLENKIRALKDNGIKCVAFSSNGSLIDKKRAESIVLSGIDEVTFSIDGATARTFESIRKGLNFEKCISNIETFIKVRNRLNQRLSIRIRMTMQESNVNEFDDFIYFWEKRISDNDAVYGKVVHNWGNWIEVENHNIKDYNSIPCQSLWTSLVILTDGRIPLCCSDYNAKVTLGDIHNDSIKNVWNSMKMKLVRKKHLKEGRMSIDMCKNCVVWDSESKVSASDDIR